MMSTTKCVIYRRFSTDEQEHGDSLTRQSRNCEAFANPREWTVSEVLTDKGRSAFKGEHLLPDAELGKFVARVESGEFPKGTILLAERLDRLSRRPVQEAMAWIHNLTSHGIQIAIADKGKVFTDKMSFEEFLGASLSLNTGNEESAKKSERIISAKLRMWDMAERREGKWTNLAGRPPLWLARNADANGWIIRADRAETIREVYAWSADGLGITKIVQRLNARREARWGISITKPNDLTWGRSAVRQLLCNPAVEGDLVPENGMFEGKVIHGFYPRIVHADVLATARANSKGRTKTKGHRASTGSTNLFAGLTMCGECGRPAFLTSHEKKEKAYRYLRCEAAGDGRCSNTVYYPYAAFEASALDLCIDLALDDRFFEASGELRELQIQQAEIDKAIGEKMARRERLMRSFDDDDDQAVGLIRTLKAEIDGFKTQLAEIKSGIIRASGKVGAVEHLRRVNGIREAAASTDPMVREQARAKLRQAFSAIINQVSIERGEDGEKVFTLSLMGGVLGVQIDARGRVLAKVTEALGRPLWETLSAENRALLEPLIRRIQTRPVPQNA